MRTPDDDLDDEACEEDTIAMQALAAFLAIDDDDDDDLAQAQREVLVAIAQEALVLKAARVESEHDDRPVADPLRSELHDIERPPGAERQRQGISLQREAHDASRPAAHVRRGTTAGGPVGAAAVDVHPRRVVGR